MICNFQQFLPRCVQSVSWPSEEGCGNINDVSWPSEVRPGRARDIPSTTDRKSSRITIHFEINSHPLSNRAEMSIINAALRLLLVQFTYRCRIELGLPLPLIKQLRCWVLLKLYRVPLKKLGLVNLSSSSSYWRLQTTFRKAFILKINL